MKAGRIQRHHISKVRADTAPVGCLDGLSQECLLGLRESENEFDQDEASEDDDEHSYGDDDDADDG